MIHKTPRRETWIVGKLGSFGRRPNGDSPPSKNPRGGRLDTREIPRPCRTREIPRPCRTRQIPRSRRSCEGGAPRVLCGVTHLFFYPQEPIVLRDPFRA